MLCIGVRAVGILNRQPPGFAALVEVYRGGFYPRNNDTAGAEDYQGDEETGERVGAAE